MWFFPFRMHFPALVATGLALACLVPVTVHGAFQPSAKPIPLSGVDTSIRTVWFSPDGAKVHGDFDQLVTWNLETRRVLSTTSIPGRKVHPSLVTSDGTFWMQGSLGYDDPAKRDINRTHPALVFGRLGDALESIKTGSTVFGKGLFIPGSRKAVFVVFEKRRYSVRAYDVATAKLSTTYVRLAKPRKRVPTDLAVSSDGKRLAVGLGGKESGAAVYDVQTGARLHLHKTRAEVTSVSFVGEELLFSDLEGHIYRWKLGGKRARRAQLVLKCPMRIIHMAVDPSGESAVIGALRGVHWVDLKQKKVRRQLLKSRAMDIRFSADGTKVAIGVQKTLQLPKIPSVYVFVHSTR